MSTLITIHVTPKASKNQIVGWAKDANGRDILKVKVAAPPEDGKANKEVLKLLAKELGVPKSALVILRGETSRHKLIELKGK